MSLDTIVDRILIEANSQKEGIVRQARQEADGIIRSAREDAQKIYDELCAQEKIRSDNQRRRAIANARLEAKKEILRAKQELIDAAFGRLKSELSKEKFRKTQVFPDKEVDVSEDIDFYLAKIRLDYEGEIIRNLFS